MGLDELKKLVRAGEFGAITLDTSIFDAQGLRLEAGLLKQLGQFQDSSTRFIISEVVKEELLSHLTQKARDSQKGIEKSLKRVKDDWLVKDQDIENIKKQFLTGVKHRKLCLNDFTNLPRLHL